MVFDVLGEAPATSRPDPVGPALVPATAVDAAPPPAHEGSPSAPARPLAPGAIGQLLRSAVALQAEGLLRTAGALAGVWGGVLDRTGWIERDARDLALLAEAAVSAGVPLPAGVDSGAGDPDHPSSVVEGLLASHEALTRVLRQLAGHSGPAEDAAAPWRPVVDGILARREEEMVLLRAVGATGQLPREEQYLRGEPPR